MKLLTADENGLLKVISLESKNYESYGVQSREECVQGMAMFSSESVQNEYQVISVLRSNGNVETWQYSFSESRLLLENTRPTDLVDPTGIKECPDIGLIAYSRSGEVSVIKDVSKAGKSREMKVKSTFSIPGPVTAWSSESEPEPAQVQVQIQGPRTEGRGQIRGPPNQQGLF